MLKSIQPQCHSDYHSRAGAQTGPPAIAGERLKYSPLSLEEVDPAENRTSYTYHAVQVRSVRLDERGIRTTRINAAMNRLIVKRDTVPGAFVLAGTPAD